MNECSAAYVASVLFLWMTMKTATKVDVHTRGLQLELNDFVNENWIRMLLNWITTGTKVKAEQTYSSASEVTKGKKIAWVKILFCWFSDYS